MLPLNCPNEKNRPLPSGNERFHILRERVLYAVEEGFFLFVLIPGDAFVELAQQAIRSFAQLLRDFHHRGDVQVALAVAAQARNALAADAEHLTGLRPLGEAILHGLAQRRHVDLRAQRRLGEGYGQIDVHVVLAALEQLVRAHADDDLQVARGAAALAQTALTADGQHLAVVDARGNLDRAALADAHLAEALEYGTGLVDDLARAAAERPTVDGLDASEGRAGDHALLTAAAAGGAGVHAGAGLRAGAVALGALLIADEVDLLLAAQRGLLEGEGQVVAQIVAGSGAVAARGAAAAGEELGKDVIGFEDEVMSVFKNYNWPGNLREMRNVVKRATLLCLGDFISLKDIPAELAAVDPVAQIEDLA